MALKEQSTVSAELHSRLSGVETEVAALDGKFDSFEADVNRRFIDLGASMNRGFSEIKAEINRKDQPVNWVAIAGLIVSSLIAGGAYVDTRLTPTEYSLKEAQEHAQNTDAAYVRLLSEVQFMRGRQSAYDERVLRNDQDLDAVQRSVAGTEALLNLLKSR